MNLQTSFRLAWNILTHSKLRSWLTIIGIIVGVAAVVLIVSIGDGAKTNLQASLSRFGTNVITVSPGADRAAGRSAEFGTPFSQINAPRSITKNLTQRDLLAISSIPEVQVAAGVVNGRASLEFQGETSSISINGVDPLKWPKFTTTSIASGRAIRPTDSFAAVIGNRVANELFKKKITLNSQLQINNFSIVVVGILDKSSGVSSEDNSVVVPLKTSRVLLGKPASIDFSSISLLPVDENNIPATIEKVESKLLNVRGERNATKTFSVTSFQSVQERISQTLNGMTLFLTAIAVVSLIIGAIGIANTMFTAVLERTKEIGIMKALGATDKDVMAVFLINSGLIGLVGGVIGISIGVAVSLAFSSLNIAFGPPGTAPLKAIVTPVLLVGMLLFSIGIGVASGLVPAYRASKLRPAQALRYE